MDLIQKMGARFDPAERVRTKDARLKDLDVDLAALWSPDLPNAWTG